METREAQESDLDAWVEMRHALWPESVVGALRDEAEDILAFATDRRCAPG